MKNCHEYIESKMGILRGYLLGGPSVDEEARPGSLAPHEN